MTLNKKKLTPIFLISIFFLMLGLSFASVPLYELFCRVTGFAGTTQVAKNKEVPKIIIPQLGSTHFPCCLIRSIRRSRLSAAGTLYLTHFLPT